MSADPLADQRAREWAVEAGRPSDNGTVPAGPDSIRAPREGERAGNAFVPVSIVDIGPAEPPEWLWRGYVARGHSTLLTALWKSGKTTLVAHLLRDVGTGGGLVDGLGGVKVLVVSEESPTIWARRRDDLGIGPHVDLLCRPFKARPGPADWRRLLDTIVELVASRGYTMVVFDTLASLWSVVNENDATDVMTALMPIIPLLERGVAVLLVHHPRKGDATEGQAARGSGALAGFVDIIVEMRRHEPENRQDRRRVLAAYSRFDETPAEAVIELTDHGYKVIGDRAEVRHGDRMVILDGLLPTGAPGLTVEEVRTAWTAEPKPGKRTIDGDLAEGCRAGRWQRTGAGKRGDPFRFRLPPGFVSGTVHPIGAGNESGPPAAATDAPSGAGGTAKGRAGSPAQSPWEDQEPAYRLPGENPGPGRDGIRA